VNASVVHAPVSALWTLTSEKVTKNASAALNGLSVRWMASVADPLELPLLRPEAFPPLATVDEDAEDVGDVEVWPPLQAKAPIIKLTTAATCSRECDARMFRLLHLR